MVYETSYGTGQKPFSPDQNRGKWEKPTDYLFACFGLALKLDLFTASYWFFFDMGIFGMLPYFVYMVIYLVPILVIHSFMGQFSSSGFISAFRLSPFFKGMGYVSGFLTLSMLIYYGIFAAVPLVFIINSLRPTMPWSCEGMNSWHNQSSDRSTICNVTDGKESLDSEYSDLNETFYIKILDVPSVMYFQSHFEKMEYLDSYSLSDQGYELSWHFVGYFVLVWGLIALIFYKFSETAKFGKLSRYMVLGTLGLLLVCLVRFLFLPGAINGLLRYVTPHRQDLGGIGSTFIMVLNAFGAGWGSVMTLSSFNKFQTNIMAYSWIISFGQVFIYILFGMVTFMLEHYFEEVKVATYDTHVMSHWMLYLSSASVLASMEWANLWTFIYYTMLLMASLTVMTTQIFTILQSLFDEFEQLRARKQEVTFGLIGGLALCSFLFCTNHGITCFSALSLDSIFSHSVLHLLLLLVVLWIYGRVRFQRDIEFMLGQPFASWKVFILRFISPIILCFTLLMGIFVASFEHSYSSVLVLVLALFLLGLPLLAIPGYGLYYLYQSSGTFCERFKRTCRPTDWYPVDTEDRQRYEEFVGNSEMTHQLFEVTEEVN
ncbi:sodium- and chloride-dependent glycine transporter 1 [Drosophila kikkawai]|uniref:Sodium- and chloride-dependent glycine transporter 1 n=1 Tax=Drosophila kikkawai TaxID=30033 RepID=A0A6P4J2K4_DROKI|nr:sodium- and chloride-dependent glycine transporter 1 [Drosophila kikkawai]